MQLKPYNGKAIEITWCADSKEQLENWIERLVELCKTKGMEVRNGKYIGSFREVFFDDFSQFRGTIHIVKIKGVTYQEIYKMVNSIKPVYFKKVDIWV